MHAIRGRLTILADNVVAGKTQGLGEHGFAVFVETDSGDFLFDTGRGGAIAHNAAVYGKDLGAVRGIVLSHGHADHTGGLPEVLRFHREIEVHSHPDVFLHRFSRTGEGKKTYGGIPFVREYLEKLGARFVFNDGFRELAPGLYLTGAVPRESGFEDADLAGRYALRDGAVVRDVLLDDQSLVFTAREGLVVLLGCAHSGMINVLQAAIRETGVDRLFAVLGGTHLDFAGEDQREKTIEALRSLNLQHLIPSHCTGMPMAARLSREFGTAFRFSEVGLTLEF